MPDIDGIELARRIRNSPTHADMPLILLSSSGVPEHLAGEIADLFDICLIKPTSNEKLLSAVHNVLDACSTRPARDAGPATVVASIDAPSSLPDDPSTDSLADNPISDDGAALAALQVLVAEDNVVNQLVIKSMLEKFGCSVSIANNGLEAGDLIEIEKPDIVLMDMSMPELDGIGATIKIRERENHGGWRAPIIGVTAHALVEDKERCLAAGMNDYLAKPVKPDALNAMLAKWRGALDHAHGGAAKTRSDAS